VLWLCADSPATSLETPRSFTCACEERCMDVFERQEFHFATRIAAGLPISRFCVLYHHSQAATEPFIHAHGHMQSAHRATPPTASGSHVAANGPRSLGQNIPLSLRMHCQSSGDHDSGKYMYDRCTYLQPSTCGQGTLAYPRQLGFNSLQSLAPPNLMRYPNTLPPSSPAGTQSHQAWHAGHWLPRAS